MSEEKEDGVQISMQQIIGAILHTVGMVKVEMDDLLRDFSEYSVEVNVYSDNLVEFSLKKIEDKAAEDDSEV